MTTEDHLEASYQRGYFDGKQAERKKILELIHIQKIFFYGITKRN